MTSSKINQPTVHTIAMIALASFIGILSGVGTILFHKLVAFIHNLFFTKHFSFVYFENLHTPAGIWGIGIILVPVLGGLIAIWLIETFASNQRGLSVPEVMYAVFCKDGRIQPSISFAKTIASAITIGTGGSVGREGPVFQIGATLSTIVSDFTHISSQQRKVLIAAGVAGCTAVIFHAPLSGIVFAIELLLTQVSLLSVSLVIIATIFSTTIEYFLNGIDPIFSIQLWMK